VSNFLPWLATLDSRILIGLGVVFAAGLVWSLIKKAVKVAVTLGILIAAVVFAVPALKNLQENYGVSYDARVNAITFRVSGQETTINFTEIKEARRYDIRFEEGIMNTTVQLYYERGDGTAVSDRGANAIKLPNFMADILRRYLRSEGIEYDKQQVDGVVR
jgi:hypothetical protein